VLRLQSDGGGRSGLPCRGLSRWPDSGEEGVTRIGKREDVDGT
jgi:hypothetical protein